MGQVGGGRARQLRWQAQGWCQAEHGKTGQAPEQALAGAARRAQGVERGQHQGKTDSDHQVAAGGGQYALPAIFRCPGFGIVGVCGGACGMFMGFDGRRRIFVGFRLQNQRCDPEALQQGQQQGGEQAGEAGGLGNALDHRGRSQWHGKAAL
ncbi:hypothetical protein D3C85_825020 [compost metagenome]